MGPASLVKATDRVTPEILYWGIRLAREVFGVETFYITENGAAFDDTMTEGGEILDLDPTDPIAKGMPEQSVAWFQDGPAFDVLDSSVVRVIGRYPTDPDKVLRSGWVLHPERVAGRAALLEVHLGRGRVVLFGFRPQYRGQSLATYPLLFNSLQVP